MPPPKLFAHLNPIQITLDVDSCLWLNAFALNLHQSLTNASLMCQQAKSDIQITEKSMYVDVKLEAIMTRVNININKFDMGQLYSNIIQLFNFLDYI